MHPQNISSEYGRINNFCIPAKLTIQSRNTDLCRLQVDTFLSTVYACVCVLYVALEDNKDNERKTMERNILGVQDSLYMTGHAMIQGCPYMLQGRILGHNYVCIVATQ